MIVVFACFIDIYKSVFGRFLLLQLSGEGLPVLMAIPALMSRLQSSVATTGLEQVYTIIAECFQTFMHGTTNQSAHASGSINVKSAGCLTKRLTMKQEHVAALQPAACAD